MRKLRKFKRVIRKLIPFRGNTRWEIQVGPLVFMVRHTTPEVSCVSFFKVWYDSYWRR